LVEQSQNAGAKGIMSYYFQRFSVIIVLLCLFVVGITGCLDKAARGEHSNPTKKTEVVASVESKQAQHVDTEKKSLTREEMIDKMVETVLTTAQNQVSWIGTMVAILGMFLVIAPFISYLYVKEWREELEREHKKSIEKFDKSMQRALDQEMGYREKRLYCVEDVIAEMWTQRSDKMDEEMATATDKQQVTEIFSRTLNAHSKDGMTLRKLLLDDPEQMFTALGDLSSRADELPKAQMLELLNLLEFHGRLSTQGTQGAAKRLRDKLNAVV
jgi:hypothetical protein